MYNIITSGKRGDNVWDKILNFFSLLKDSTIKYMIKNERTRDFLLDIIKYYIDLDLKDYTLIDNEKNSWRRS